MTRMVMPTAWGNHPENHVENHPENQKSSQKSSQKILALLLKDSQITTQEIANELGISRRAVAKQIANMSKKVLSPVLVQIKAVIGK